MDRLERLAPLTGIAAVGFFVAEALVSGDTPTIDDSAHDIVAFWEGHVTQAELASGFMGLSAVAFVWFGASLRSALRGLGEGAERLGSIAHAGTVLIAVGLFTYASLGLALVHSVGDVPDSVTQTLTAISGEDLFLVFAVGTALLVLSTAIAIMRYGALPRWLGWVSLVLGVVALVVVFLGALVPGVGYIAWLLLVLWIPTVSILLYRRQPVVP
jgi:hypothetical protein